ncbi:MAG TPA: DUF2127 domain-containing protein [Actinomycetota bacterium]
MTDRGARPLPGIEKPKRFRPTFHYELIACGFSGHELVGMDAAHVRPQDAAFVREEEGTRWYRCLRCDSWLPLAPPSNPAKDHPPDRDHIELPLRGRALRDKFVLRLIAIDRGLHFLVLAVLAAAVFLFAANRDDLQNTYLRLLQAFQGTVGGTSPAPHGGILGELAKVFSYSSQKLLLTGLALAAYGVVEGVEAVGLWYMQRWAEYLTLIVTASFLPLEIYELTARVSVLKIVAFVLNIAVVVYLLYAKRLFGIRGGAAAEHEARREDSGWDALDRATPGATPQRVERPSRAAGA